MVQIPHILKFKLLLFFTTTFISLVAFYFADRLPDHYLSISSTNGPYLNYFSYYMTSIVASVGRYTGPWIFFPFVGYALFYTFIYARRKFWADIFNGFSLTIFFLFLAWIFFPASLGDSARYLLNLYFSPAYGLLLGLLFGLSFLWGTFPSSLNKGLIWLILRVGKMMAKKNLAKKEKAIFPDVEVKEEKKEKAPSYGQITLSAIGATSNEAKELAPNSSYFKETKERIEKKLAEFSIEGKIINILKGPVVDTFELKLGSGVKLSRVVATENDLSVALLGTPIRMVYPMMGRSTLGIEVPRTPRKIIALEDIIASKEFVSFKGELPMAMGQNAFGENFIADLAQMPHMLVAGLTGAGKSVFINSLLFSLLYKLSPSQMQLLLIDPKQLELSLYRQLPHLVMPTLTEAGSAYKGLTWAIGEMERRYSLLGKLEVRSIADYNEKMGAKESLPYLVIVIDEFADLILSPLGRKIEHFVCRLAAKARSAGIHLVVATQRPSVDVITGLIKSNFPTRVSFKVTSSIDSRTILTSSGAEKLLGQGDMLYLSGPICKRVHSAIVKEESIRSLMAKVAHLGQNFNSHAMTVLKKEISPPQTVATTLQKRTRPAHSVREKRP